MRRCLSLSLLIFRSAPSTLICRRSNVLDPLALLLAFALALLRGIDNFAVDDELDLGDTLRFPPHRRFPVSFTNCAEERGEPPHLQISISL